MVLIFLFCLLYLFFVNTNFVLTYNLVNLHLILADRSNVLVIAWRLF